MPFFNKFGGGSARKFGLAKGFNLNPPTNLSAISTATSVSISFTAPLGDTPTNIAYALSTNGGSTYGAFTDLSPADFTSPITISGLTSNQAYVVKLRSTIDTNQSQDSQTLSFQTLAVAPTSLSTSGATASAITVSFTQATGGGATISNYKYALSTNGGSTYGSYTALSPADATSPISISGLTSNQAYFVKIRAVTAAGDGDESAATSFTTLKNNLTVEYLVVGAGGSGGWGGGSTAGSGGGGGGIAQGSFTVSTAVTYTATVGTGGVAGNGSTQTGGTSSFAGTGLTTITCTGGTGGTNTAAGTGGTASNGATNTTGGSGGAGINSGTASNGTGGTTSTITGSSVGYGGGGGGSTKQGTQGTGVNGGGNGAANGGGVGARGGGGGGSGADDSVGGNGGKGIIIVKVPTGGDWTISVTGSPTTSSISGFTVYTFNGTGTIGYS